jgi:hypothetical protein
MKPCPNTQSAMLGKRSSNESAMVFPPLQRECAGKAMEFAAKTFAEIDVVPVHVKRPKPVQLPQKCARCLFAFVV